MEGDAKGQVGGMEMPQKERERMAGESRAWKCHGCGGRTNEDILKEEGGAEGEGKSTEQAIPEELKFGFRDQMGKSDDDKTADAERAASKPATTPVTPLTGSAGGSAALQSSVEPNSTSLAAPSTAPVSLQPTRTVPAVAPAHAPPTPAAMPQAPSNGVPPWVDKAITGLVAALAVMVFKKIIL